MGYSLQEIDPKTEDELTAGEVAVASLIEHYGETLSAVAQDDLVANLDGYDRVAVKRATDDILGINGFERDKFRVGKFPSIDELLPRCRHHQNEIAKAKNRVRYIAANKNKGGVSDNSPFDIKREAHRYAVRGRAILDEDLTPLEFEKRVRAKKYPVGSSYFAFTGNVYALKPETR